MRPVRDPHRVRVDRRRPSVAGVPALLPLPLRESEGTTLHRGVAGQPSKLAIVERAYRLAGGESAAAADQPEGTV